jgi:putative spermidine/putrescine transport system permease protein
MTAVTEVPPLPANRRRRISAGLFRNPRLRLTALLTLPLGWLLIVYFAALFSLLVTSLFGVDEFTGAVVHTFTLQNFKDVFTDPAYIRVTLRTVGIAATVTLICAVLAVPMSFFMAKVVRSALARRALLALMITPLWASYLVKVYAWQAMVQPRNGVLAWLLAPIGRGGPGYGITAVILTLSYMWLPYMVLPVYAGLDRLPDSYLEASADLGARPVRTFRRIVLPLLWPSIVAGSIFTFSLSLGDFITVQVVGAQTQMLGNVVWLNYAADLPFAAAVAMIPVIIMLVYLGLARRTGALDNL